MLIWLCAGYRRLMQAAAVELAVEREKTNMIWSRGRENTAHHYDQANTP
jgi:hypothetical protein